ncbi:MAG: MaoC family dehydratase N-terminal domain-containing protein [Chloroflexi bacterium]|nr:MaoC family dehydratase N-terminal domain-containing protein [Chloroflexota bacterium]
MPDDSLIPDAARAMVGQEMESVTDTIESGAIRRYAQAMGNPSPLYLDEEYARGTRYGGVIAPPLFLGTLAAYPPGYPEPSEDGIGGRTAAEQVDLPLKRVIVGGQEWEFFEPARPGDRITVTSRLVELRETVGRQSGPMIVNVKESTYTNQRGQVVAICRHTRLLR